MIEKPWLIYWVAVEELSLSYLIGETLSFPVYIPIIWLLEHLVLEKRSKLLACQRATAVKVDIEPEQKVQRDPIGYQHHVETHTMIT